MARLGNNGPAEAHDAHCSATSPPGSRLIVVLDIAGVEGLAPIDEERRARLRLLRDQTGDLVLPAAVLAENVLAGHPGRDYHVRRLLELLNIVDVDAATGHAAGALRRAASGAGMDPPPSGVDTIVGAAADARAANDDVLIVTSDQGDFQMLGSLAPNAARISVLAV